MITGHGGNTRVLLIENYSPLSCRNWGGERAGGGGEAWWVLNKKKNIIRRKLSKKRFNLVHNLILIQIA